jgi:hypothetical protein
MKDEDRLIRVLVDSYDYRLVLRRLGPGKVEFSVDYPNNCKVPDRAELDPDEVIEALQSLKKEAL